jgi:hypothetical protein
MREKRTGKNPGDKTNIDIVVLKASGKGGRCRKAEETDVLNSLQRKCRACNSHIAYLVV